MDASSKAQCLKVVKECWNSFSTESIQKSFCSCGISLNVIGFENAEIHCLQAGEVATLAAPSIADLTRKLLQEDEGNQKDPFTSVDNESGKGWSKTNQ